MLGGEARHLRLRFYHLRAQLLVNPRNVIHGFPLRRSSASIRREALQASVGDPARAKPLKWPTSTPQATFQLTFLNSKLNHFGPASTGKSARRAYGGCTSGASACVGSRQAVASGARRASTLSSEKHTTSARYMCAVKLTTVRTRPRRLRDLRRDAMRSAAGRADSGDCALHRAPIATRGFAHRLTSSVASPPESETAPQAEVRNFANTMLESGVAASIAATAETQDSAGGAWCAPSGRQPRPNAEGRGPTVQADEHRTRCCIAPQRAPMHDAGGAGAAVQPPEHSARRRRFGVCRRPGSG